MTAALMLAIAAGVAAWVLAPLWASARRAARNPSRAQAAGGSDPLPAQEGGQQTPPGSEVGGPGAVRSAPNPSQAHL